MNFFDGTMVNDAEWARSGAKGAAFCNVAKEVARDTISEKDRAFAQQCEDQIAALTATYLRICDPKFYDDQVIEAREIQDPDKLVETLRRIDIDRANVSNSLRELQLQTDNLHQETFSHFDQTARSGHQKIGRRACENKARADNRR